MTRDFTDSREGFAADEFEAHQFAQGEPTDGDWDECARYWDEAEVEFEDDLDEVWDYDDSMDGDFDSAMRDAGWGTDEDYGYYGECEDYGY